jgi:transcriptional regulator with XRE-family HTH domain
MSIGKKIPILPRKLAELRDILHLTKEQFAGALEVSRIAVLHWEQGSSPSAEMFIRLAKLAQNSKKPALALWFYEQAGVDVSVLRKLVPEIDESLRSSQRKMKVEVAKLGKGEFVNIPLLGDFARGDHEAVIERLRAIGLDEVAGVEARIPFPVGIIPRPNETICVRAPDDYMRPVFRQGDLIAVDVHTMVIAPVGSVQLERAFIMECDYSPAFDRYIYPVVLAYHTMQEGARYGSRRGLHIRKVFFSGGEERKNVTLSTEVSEVYSNLRGLPVRAQNLLAKAKLIDAREEDESSDLVITGDREWSILGRVVAWIGSNREPRK